MIQRIRTSKTFKGLCLTLALSIFFELVAPTQAWALTGGPSQPEFSSFTPIGTSDMVDLSSGDMSYNIPLMDVGGYPLNIAYNAGSGMDQEASWVGLGWNLSPGQIARNVRGIPDDFDGDEMVYENYLRPNVTAGVDFQLNPALAGFDYLDLNFGAAAIFNNYTGFSITPSVGIGIDLGNNASVGFNIKSGEDGLTVSPNLSIHANSKTKSDRDNKLSANVGVSWNSRNGVSQMTMGVTRKTEFKNAAKNFNKKGNKRMDGSQSIGSSIGFAEQLYTPSRRVGMETGGFTVNAAFGGEIYTVEVQGQITGFGTVMVVKPSERNKTVSAYGYCNTENADEYGILDFNREKDGNFSVSSTNLPVTNYTYDIYSVQGQGVGGMYRPFRNQVGYVYDARVEDGSNSGSFGLEIGSGGTVHLGGDVEVTNVSSHSGLWEDNNYVLPNLEERDYGVDNYERVHFKNVGDLSADLDYQIFTNNTGSNHIGGYDPVRIPFNEGDGGKFNRYTESKYHKKLYNNSENPIAIGGAIQRTQRQKRNQAIYNLTKREVENGIGYGPVAYNEVSLAHGRAHHTAEVQIIRNDGARYIYGLPAYNVLKKEATFAVDKDKGDCSTGLALYDPSDLVASESTKLPNDQYFNRIKTPAYVHTHLLTSVLSTDYADKLGDGPTPDDFGSYTKFSYTAYEDMEGSSSDLYRWRVPLLPSSQIPFGKAVGTYNEGLKTDSRDDQASYQYGEKEMYYINKIETKTHVAIFHSSIRKDAKGASGEQGATDNTQHSYKLDKISLYSIEEYDENNVDGSGNNLSVPIKEVHFEYSYSLCPGVYNNEGPGATLSENEISNFGGKLTLKKIYFTYRNSKMGKYTGYTFNYGEFLKGGMHVDEYSDPSLIASDLNTTYNGSPNSGLNPAYNIKGYDSWGNYMPTEDAICGNVPNTSVANEPTPAEFPYTEQDKDIQNVRAQVWCMRRINLPSGGNISVKYESDSYASVQDKAVNRMFKVMGSGDLLEGSINGDYCSDLYGLGLLNNPRKYIYVEVDPTTATGTTDVNKYLGGLYDKPVYFRFLTNTTNLGATSGHDDNAHFDYVAGYFNIETGATVFPGSGPNSGRKYLSIPVVHVDKEGGGGDVHPVSKATWHFARKFLSKYAYGTQPNTSSEEVEAIVNQMVNTSMFDDLMEIFEGPNGVLENKGVGRRFVKDKSWVRLNEPDGEKLGGGCRVSEVRMSDVWQEMNPGQSDYQTMNYGQSYIYTINSKEGGKTSGVATYEPIGNKENPFVQPVYSKIEKLLAPDEENYMEKPFGESFFPSPQITYGKVTVANLTAGEYSGKTIKQLHKTGSVVTEFYTSKDYPTIVNQTKLQAEEDKSDFLSNILSLNVKKHFTMSQGYTIHLNDMNGKQKSQRVYAEGQSAAISGVDYIYDNHASSGGFNSSADPDRNKGKLDNLVTVIEPNGDISKKVIGVETDIVNDFRENKSKTRIAGVNLNLAAFIAAMIPIAIPVPLPDYSQTEDLFRSVSTTKVINTFGLLKETIAYDAGAAVYTRNLAWDAATGEVLLTETIDEFNDKYYTLNYPAHWYYSGMAQAALNIGMRGNLSGTSGVYMFSSINLMPGDELYVSNTSNFSDGEMVWVAPNGADLIDESGGPFVTDLGTNPNFIVVRSGHRNLQSAGIMNVTLMHNPLLLVDGTGVATEIDADYLVMEDWADWRIINAGAVDYSDDWEVDCECGVNPGEGIQNPYRINQRGVWRTKSSRTYLTGRTGLNDLKVLNADATVTPRNQGFFKTFAPMYKCVSDVWTKDMTPWTFVAEVSKYSPYGFELENSDALERYSAAQYGYNNSFPVAVGANTKYDEIGFDGFEDYNFMGCQHAAHFKFTSGGTISSEHSHTGKHSIKLVGDSRTTMKKKLVCED